VVWAIDLESRTWDIVIRHAGKKAESLFMCKMPKGVNHLVRRSAANNMRAQGVQGESEMGSLRGTGLMMGNGG